MSNKAQALALLQDHQISIVEISTVGEICRRHLEEIRRNERVTAQRAIVLGLTLWKIRISLPHGQWMPWQEKHLAAGKSQVNYFMRLAVAFLSKSRATKTELRALPTDSIELSAETELSRSLLGRLEKFVGECSLHELLVKHGIKGVSRDTGGAEGEAGSEGATPGEQMLFPEMCEAVSRLDRLFIPEAIVRVPPEQLKPLRTEWERTKARIDARFEEALGRKK